MAVKFWMMQSAQLTKIKNKNFNIKWGMRMTADHSEDENLQVTMQLIMSGGNAKGSAVEAIRAAKQGDFATADVKLAAANKFLGEAHDAQTSLLTEEARGHHANVNLLMVHGQDHVMNAITFKDLATEIVDLYKCLADK